MVDFLFREEAKVSKHGYKPEDRPIDLYIKNGVVVLDKWPGPTCHILDSFIGKKFGLTKIGHSGTLDPGVSGVLVIALENSCKLISLLQRVDKEYVGIIHFHKNVSEESVKTSLKKFIGTIKQKPPRISAVARKLRKRKIYDIQLLDLKERNACVYVRCEAGTYIRVLFHQIGEALKVGAHMKELRRLKSGNFTENDSKKMHEIIDAYDKWKESGDERDLRKVIIPLEKSVEYLKSVFVKDSSIYSLSNGSPLFSNGLVRVQSNIEKDDDIAIFSLKRELIAIGKANISANDMISKNTLAVKIKRVIIEKDLYPKIR